MNKEEKLNYIRNAPAGELITAKFFVVRTNGEEICMIDMFGADELKRLGVKFSREANEALKIIHERNHI